MPPLPPPRRMPPSLAALVLWALVLLLPRGASGQAPEDYGYPISDPLEATVMGTPPEYRYPAPERIPAETWRLAQEGRRAPDIFWYASAMPYSVALQPGRAPLVFIVPGTGGGHDSAKAALLQKELYGAGWHAVSLPSPTHISFIVGASKTRVPGYTPDDVRDLYEAMASILNDLKGRAEITDVCLVGYSLGGLHAAHLARLDQERGVIGFKRTFLINPPVDLVASAGRLDDLFGEKSLGGESPLSVLNRLTDKLSELYKRQQQMELSEDYLYGAVRQIGLSRRELLATIGASFRFSSMNMAFASDVCTGMGYLVPAGHRIRVSEPLEPYLDQAVNVGFREYFKEYLMPFLQHREPGLSSREAARRMGMADIREFLATAENVGATTNEDEIILSGEDLAFLRETFGMRLTVYPRGGHCGNMSYAENVEHMLGFLGGRL